MGESQEICIWWLSQPLPGAWLRELMTPILQATAAKALSQEAKLLRQYDYAWNTRQAGCQPRHINIITRQSCCKTSTHLVSCPALPVKTLKAGNSLFIDAKGPLGSSLQNVWSFRAYLVLHEMRQSFRAAESTLGGKDTHQGLYYMRYYHYSLQLKTLPNLNMSHYRL